MVNNVFAGLGVVIFGQAAPYILITIRSYLFSPSGGGGLYSVPAPCARDLGRVWVGGSLLTGGLVLRWSRSGRTYAVARIQRFALELTFVQGLLINSLAFVPLTLTTNWAH